MSIYPYQHCTDGEKPIELLSYQVTKENVLQHKFASNLVYMRESFGVFSVDFECQKHWNVVVFIAMEASFRTSMVSLRTGTKGAFSLNHRNCQQR